MALDSVAHTPDENARVILDYLIQHDFVRTEGGLQASAGDPMGRDVLEPST